MTKNTALGNLIQAIKAQDAALRHTAENGRFSQRDDEQSVQRDGLMAALRGFNKSVGA